MRYKEKGALLLLGLFLLVSGRAQPVEYGNNTAAGSYHEVRGIRLYAETYGNGVPLILLHGNGGSIASMASIIPYFSRKYHVIAVDSRAQGKSVDGNDSLSFEMMADDVAALMTQMHIKEANFIGWSDGGIIALEMAMRHPETVIRLAATGANLRPDSTAFPAAVWLDWQQEYEAGKCKDRNTDAAKKSWKLFLLDWLQPHISPAELERIKKPSLIIAGDHDLIRPEHTLEIFRHIPDSQLWIVPHSGHATLQEHPQAFCETVDRFFEEK